MNRFSAILIILLFAAPLSFAQTPAFIAGKVREAATSNLLPGANVTVIGTQLGAFSDATGEFRIDGVLPGAYEIRVSFVGYAARTKRVDVTTEGVSIDFTLEPTMITGQPITVSGTRGRERETPVTFSTLSRTDIRDQYTTQDIPVLLSELPSTTYYSDAGNGIGYTYLNIRGFDARRIAVMVNGIPQNDPEDHNVYWLDIPDIAGSLEDIQVQRGAGSAFYGSPAIGGSVNLVTSSFGRKRELSLSAGVGSFNTRKYSASFSSGLIENRYALHGRLSKILSSGYRDRSWVDFNSYFFGAIRYDESMTTQVNFYGGPISDHLAYYGIPKLDVKDKSKRRTNPILREEEMENFSQPHYELLHEWRLTPTLTLNNTAFIILGDGFFDYDGTWAPFSYYRLTQGNGFSIVGDPDTLYFGSALIRATVKNKQFGWLPRITLKHDDGEFIAGAEVRFHRSLHWGRLQRVDMSPVSIPEDYRYYEYKGAKDIISFYAHELYSLQPDLNLMVNLQYVFNCYRLHDEKFLNTNFAVPYHFLNPRIGINYNLDEKWNTYLSLAYTSREPRLKNLYDAAEASTPASWGAIVPQFAVDANGQFSFDQPLVKPERLLDIEFGGGFSAPEVSTTANVYWMEFTNEIVKSGQVDRFGQPITGNASRTRHIGIELTGTYKPAPSLELRGNATFSRNSFVRHTDFSSDSPLSLNNNPIAGFPDVLANLRVTYRYENVAVSLAGRFVGKQYTDNFKNETNTVDAYFVSDGWIAYTMEDLFDDVNIEAKLQVNNLSDRLYAAYGEGDQFFVGAERNMFFNLSIHL
ncbi:MAG: TonB-dependent receptor [Bacteroidota bacterium]